MKFNVSLLFVLFISLLNNAEAFEAPDKISNIDLRTISTVLSIREPSGAEHMLKKSTAGQYFLASVGKNSSPLYKVGHNKAKKIDEDFVATFINLKYMMTPHSGKNCKEIFSLSMRGEDLKICEGEIKKIADSQKLVLLFKDTYKNN
jgi:hypothetical protein